VTWCWWICWQNYIHIFLCFVVPHIPSFLSAAVFSSSNVIIINSFFLLICGTFWLLDEWERSGIGSCFQIWFSKKIRFFVVMVQSKNIL
jgi:hypothetical protein